MDGKGDSPIDVGNDTSRPVVNTTTSKSDEILNGFLLRDNTKLLIMDRDMYRPKKEEWTLTIAPM